MRKTKGGLQLMSNEELLQKMERIHKNEKNRGLLLLGLPGSGKTHFFYQYLNWLEGRNAKISEKPIFKEASQIILDYDKKGDLIMTDTSSIDSISYGLVGGRPLYIDDLGVEYGTKWDNKRIIADIIHTMYSNRQNPLKWYWGQQQPRLFATTNLNLTELESMYGARTVDRLKEMCYIVILDSDSKRETEEL